MSGNVTNAIRAICGSIAVALVAVVMSGASAQAESLKQQYSGTAESYVPAIWVDPDGCEHWAMDDGTEGYMTPNRMPDGTPVCHRGNPCLVMNSDQLFATGKSAISADSKRRLAAFFKTSGATAYVIDGHTDPRGGSAYNLNLSLQRANSVANVAREVGVPVSKVRGFGPTEPIASNNTAEGMARNRRVEIFCIR